ncbi:MAG: CapA family protein [Polyangiaceae bacterium]|nr:CapA family protein [Polyangiaceae bacterium]
MTWLFAAVATTVTACDDDRAAALFDGGVAPAPPAIPELARASASGAPRVSSSGARSTAASVPVASASCQSARRRLVILGGGDVNLARDLGQEILRDPSQVRPLASLSAWIDSSDLFFVNLESQLSDQGGETQSPYNRLVFTGPPAGAEVLAASRVDLVSLANNHMWDYGKRALFSTFDQLDRVNVQYVGATREPNRAYEPLVIRRGDWSIAVFAVTQIWNQGAFEEHEGRAHVAWARFDRLAKGLVEARRAHDVVLLAYHGGAEYLDLPMAWTKEFVHWVMRTGVDGVLGHHPHVPQGVEWHGQRPVFYSLGNLVFGMHRDHEWTGTGYLARLSFERPPGCETVSCQVFAAEACPYRIQGTTPLPYAGPGRAALDRMFRGMLDRVSKRVGGTELGETGSDGCIPLRPPERAGLRKSRVAPSAITSR